MRDHLNPETGWLVWVLVICTVFCLGGAAAAQNLGSQASIAIRAVIPPVYPHAGFTGAPLTGTAPLTVSFTDLSTGTITSWAWDFGDGGTSTQRNPVHTYQKQGTYKVRLTVSGPAGSNTLTKPSYIKVKKPVKKPEARFDQDVCSGKAPLTVRFTDRSLNDPTDFFWEFGDRSTSHDKNPSHVYTRPGIYLVRLTASNSKGSDTAWGIVTAIPLRWCW
jgi:PKD repeat protein